MRDDVVTLEAEVAEIKEKSLVPLAETSNISPFEQAGEDDYAPGQRGYRALVVVGHLDTDVSGLTPANPQYSVAGASSDLTVLNLGPNPNGLRIGDRVAFRLDYSAFLRLMNSRYVQREVDYGDLLPPDASAGDCVPAILPEYEMASAGRSPAKERGDDS